MDKTRLKDLSSDQLRKEMERLEAALAERLGVTVEALLKTIANRAKPAD